MTYLHQLRAHFTGHQLEVQQIGKTSEESNYVIGKFNTDKDTDITKQVFGQEIINLRKAKQSQQLNKSQDSKKEKELNQTNKEISQNQDTKIAASKLQLPLKITNEPAESPKEPKEKSPTVVKDMKDIILLGSKSIMSKVMSSPSKDKIQTKKQEEKKVEVKKPILMTRRELTDPFGSDDEEEEADNKVINNKVPEVNEMNGCGDHKVKEKDAPNDVFSDLPKPNVVRYCLF